MRKNRRVSSEYPKIRFCSLSIVLRREKLIKNPLCSYIHIENRQRGRIFCMFFFLLFVSLTLRAADKQDVKMSGNSTIAESCRL